MVRGTWEPVACNDAGASALRRRASIAIAGAVIPIPTRIGGFWFRWRLRRLGNADCCGDGRSAGAERVKERATTDVPARVDVCVP